ncbi:MAG: NF038122 family metalloprotease [Crocosphaera sp.]|nr:NF038122 family metalloprotease [Crocosphaera sp.]
MTITQNKNLKTSWENAFSLLEKIGGTTTGKKLAKQWVGKIALMLAGTAATATPAHALKINPTYSSEIDLTTAQAIEASFSVWESELKDPVTLNINFSFANDLPTGVLAGAKPSMIKVRYQDYLTALGQDSLSSQDISAVRNFLEDDDLEDFDDYVAGNLEDTRFRTDDTRKFDVLLDNTIQAENSSSQGNAILDDNSNSNNRTIWLTRANGKALGLIAGNHSQLDADIVFSSLANWDMDSSDGISTNAYDFETVVRHEIGHTLGFISGGDAIEYMAASATGTLQDTDIDYVTPLNTYVHSDTSANVEGVVLDLTSGTQKYLSFDGGNTKVTNEQGNIAFFSTGTSVGGDGFQNSHWKNDLLSPLGIMNPALGMGQSLSISSLERQTFDVIGWDLVEQAKTLMEDVGMDWNAFQLALKNNHQTVLGAAAADWVIYNPGEDSIQADLEAELWELYKDIDPQIIQELLTLQANLNNGGTGLTPEQQIANTDQAIWNLIYGQDNQLQLLSEDLRDVTTRVPGWLNQDNITLSNLLQDANSVEIKKLHKVLQEATEQDRLVWEDKIRQAFALFLDNPQQALDQLNNTNNFQNNMGGGSGSSGTGGGGWGGWWSSSVTEADELGFYNHVPSNNDDNTEIDMGGGSGSSGTGGGGWGGWWSTAAPANAAQPAQSVPEPSAIIGLVALGGMGWLTRKSKH